MKQSSLPQPPQSSAGTYNFAVGAITVLAAVLVLAAIPFMEDELPMEELSSNITTPQ